jgi:hypothetical protein
MAKDKGGRPTKLNRLICNEICESIKQKLPPHTAAQKAGICKNTHDNWIRKGKEAKSDTKYRKYLNAIEAAKAYAANDLIQKIEKSGDWKAHKWLLEKMDPEVYREETKKTLKLEGDLKHEHSIKHNEQLLKDPLWIKTKSKSMDNYYKQNKNKKKEAPDQ